MAVITAPVGEDSEVDVSVYSKTLRLHQGVNVLVSVAALSYQMAQARSGILDLFAVILLLGLALPAAVAFVMGRRSVHRTAITLDFLLSVCGIVHVVTTISLEAFDRGAAPHTTKQPFYVAALAAILLISGTAPWGPELKVVMPPKTGIFAIASLDEEKETPEEQESLLSDPEVIVERSVMRVRQSSWLSFIFIGWPSDLILLANKKEQLASTDIPLLPRELRGMTATLAPNSLYYQISAARKPFSPEGKPQPPLTSKWLLWLCARSHWKPLLVDFLVRLVAVIVGYAPPFILHALIDSFDTDLGVLKDEASHNLQIRTFLLCGALSASQILGAILSSHNDFISEVYILSLIRAQLAAVLFDKALTQQERVSTELDHTSSKIINLLSGDSNALPDALRHFRNVVIPLFRLGLGCVFIYKVGDSLFTSVTDLLILGWPGLVAMLLTFLLFPGSSALGRWSFLTDRRLSHARDKRVSLVQETVAAIKTIKLNAWEPKAEDRIKALRDSEVKLQRERFWIGTCWNVAWAGVPVLIQLVAFMLYTKVQGKVLTPSVAFVSLNVFNICSSALTDIPSSINDIFSGLVSLQRFVGFLNGGDLVPCPPLPADRTHLAVMTQDAAVAWPTYGQPDERFILELGDLEFPEDQNTIVCGALGSGKTLLLRAILGEAEVIKGTVHAELTQPDGISLPEDAAFISDAKWLQPGATYVPQSTYIRHASIRDNILFGLPHNAKRYQLCLESCALNPDLQLLEDGDLTEVGERGVTLSGGQKARLALARALYSRSEVLIIDDVLAAVDAHTSAHIVRHCFQGPLIHSRTMILATHSVAACLPIAKQVIELSGRRVSFCGSPSQYSTAVHPPSPSVSKKSRRDPLESPSEMRQHHVVENAPKTGKAPRKLVEVEHRAIGRVEWSAYRFMLGSAGSWWYWLVFSVIFVGTQGVSLAESAWVREWTAVIGTPVDSSLGFYLGVYAALIWLGIFADAARWIWLYEGFTSVGARTIHLRALKALLSQSLRFFDTTPQGRILARFGNDITRLDGHFPDDFGRTCLYSLQIFTPVIIILTIAPAFGVIVLCSIPFFVAFYSYYIKGTRDIRRIEIVASAPVTSLFAECATVPAAAAVIRSFGACRLMMVSMMRVRDVERANTYASWASQLWAYLCTNIANAIITSATGVLLVWKREQISAAQAGFTLLLSNQIAGAVLLSLQRLVNLELTMISGQRIYEYASRPTEVSVAVGRDVPAGWPFTGDIVIQDLRAGYSSGLPDVLRDINLKITSGDRVGVVGATGGGKSTLVSTLFRLVDIRSGSVLIDGIDVANVRLADLRSRLTIVPQDPVLMSGTLRSTLDYLGEHEDVTILQALRNVHLLHDSDDMNDRDSASIDSRAAPTSVFANLDNVVASGGVNFSLGQRQLLVLAQSLLKQSKILVLDEATASIDHHTDSLIADTIRNAFHGATLLVVAHRLRTIIDFDKVIVLNAGQVVEYDNPASLLADTNSRFHALCKASGPVQFAELKRMAAAHN